MPWLNQVAAVIEDWYPGEEDGNAIAAVLYGDVDPSGHLPVTFPVSAAQSAIDSPAQWPGVNLVSDYTEGLDVGYRYDHATGYEAAVPLRLRPLLHPLLLARALPCSASSGGDAVSVRVAEHRVADRDGGDPGVRHRPTCRGRAAGSTGRLLDGHSGRPRVEAGHHDRARQLFPGVPRWALDGRARSLHALRRPVVGLIAVERAGHRPVRLRALDAAHGTGTSGHGLLGARPVTPTLDRRESRRGSPLGATGLARRRRGNDPIHRPLRWHRRHVDDLIETPRRPDRNTLVQTEPLAVSPGAIGLRVRSTTVIRGAVVGRFLLPPSVDRCDRRHPNQGVQPHDQRPQPTRLQGRRSLAGRVRPPRDRAGRARDARAHGHASRARLGAATPRVPDHRAPCT